MHYQKLYGQEMNPMSVAESYIVHIKWCSTGAETADQNPQPQNAKELMSIQSVKKANLFAVSTGIAISDRLWINAQFRETCFPFCILSFIHQAFDAIYKGKVLTLHSLSWMILSSSAKII